MVAIYQGGKSLNKKNNIMDFTVGDSPTSAGNVSFDFSNDQDILTKQKEDIINENLGKLIEQQNFPEDEIRAKRPFNYMAEQNLLNDYLNSLQKQSSIDSAFIDDSKRKAEEIRRARISDQENKDYAERRDLRNLVGTIIAGTPTSTFIGGKEYNQGVDWGNVGSNYARNAISNVNEERKDRAEKEQELLKELGLDKSIYDEKRKILETKGKGVEEYAKTNQRAFDLEQKLKRLDPQSQLSKDYAESFNSTIKKKIEEINLDKDKGGEQRDRYRNMLPLYQYFLNKSEGKSAEEIDKLNAQLKEADADTAKKVDQDIKEKMYESMNARFNAQFGNKNEKDDFEKRERLSKMAQQAEEAQKAISMMDELYQLAQDPEVQKGFGTKTFGKIKEMSGVGLTPKQARFQFLIGETTSEIIKKRYGSAFTGGEETRANEYLVNPDQTLGNLLGKADGMRNVAAKGLNNTLSRLYYISYNANFNQRYGLPKTNEKYTTEQYNLLSQISPYDLISGAAPSVSSRTKEPTPGEVKKDIKPVPKKIFPKNRLQEYADMHTGGNIDEAIKEITGEGNDYVIK